MHQQQGRISKSDILNFRKEYQEKRIISVPLLTNDKALHYLYLLMQSLPDPGWTFCNFVKTYNQVPKRRTDNNGITLPEDSIMLESEDIGWGMKNLNIITEAWNKTLVYQHTQDVNSAIYFYRYDHTEEIISTNILEYMKKIIPEINKIKDIIVMLMTPGCYVKNQVDNNVRFMIHLSLEWGNDKGGIIEFPDMGMSIVPKFSYMTFFDKNVKYNITPIQDNPCPYLMITGTLEY